LNRASVWTLAACAGAEVGAHALLVTDSTLLRDLERLVSESCRGDPESPLVWTSKSVRHLAAALCEQSHTVHYTTVAKLLGLLGYSLQANVKTREGASHPDRDVPWSFVAGARAST
jgi:hypothetical protein